MYVCLMRTQISGVVSQTQMLLAANYNADLDNAFQLVYTSYYGT